MQLLEPGQMLRNLEPNSPQALAIQERLPLTQITTEEDSGTFLDWSLDFTPESIKQLLGQNLTIEEKLGILDAFSQELGQTDFAANTYIIEKVLSMPDSERKRELMTNVLQRIAKTEKTIQLSQQLLPVLKTAAQDLAPSTTDNPRWNAQLNQRIADFDKFDKLITELSQKMDGYIAEVHQQNAA